MSYCIISYHIILYHFTLSYITIDRRRAPRGHRDPHAGAHREVRDDEEEHHRDDLGGDT